MSDSPTKHLLFKKKKKKIFSLLPIRKSCFFSKYLYLTKTGRKKKNLCYWVNPIKKDTQNPTFLIFLPSWDSENNKTRTIPSRLFSSSVYRIWSGFGYHLHSAVPSTLLRLFRMFPQRRKKPQRANGGQNSAAQVMPDCWCGLKNWLVWWSSVVTKTKTTSLRKRLGNS